MILLIILSHYVSMKLHHHTTRHTIPIQAVVLYRSLVVQFIEPIKWFTHLTVISFLYELSTNINVSLSISIIASPYYSSILVILLKETSFLPMD